jgi:hypothetical protein
MKMSVQRLHAFEKTSIQARHSMKRLEMICDSAHATSEEREIAGKLLNEFNEIRKIIPAVYQDVDLKEKEL